MNTLMFVIKAAWRGRQLRNPALWKRWAALSAVLLPFLATLAQQAHTMGWIPIELSQTQLESIGYWLWQGSGVVIAWWTYATSRKIGYVRRHDPEEIDEFPYELGPEEHPNFRDRDKSDMRDVGGSRLRRLRYQAKADPQYGDDPDLSAFNEYQP